MNRWHRLHSYFRRADSIEDAIMLAINGFDPPVSGISYPNIAARFAHFEGWLNCPDCYCVKFEDLISERQPEVLRNIAEFYSQRTSTSLDVAAAATTMTSLIAPQKSHTFRSGKKAGWQREFTPAHRARFVEVAGDLLVRLGYESNHEWAKIQSAAIKTP